MGSLRNLEHTLYKNFQYEIFCPIETCISRPPTPQWFSWFQHVHERGLQVDFWLRSSRRKATALNYFFETGRPLCHLSMLHTPAFASFSFIVLTRKWCSWCPYLSSGFCNILWPSFVSSAGSDGGPRWSSFRLLFSSENPLLQVCWTTASPASGFQTVVPEHTTNADSQDHSQDLLNRKSWVGSGIIQQSLQATWSTGKFRNCRFQSATRELGTNKSEAKDWEQRATAKEDGCHEPLHSLPFIG